LDEKDMQKSEQMNITENSEIEFIESVSSGSKVRVCVYCENDSIDKTKISMKEFNVIYTSLLEWAVTGKVGGVCVCQPTKDRAKRYIHKYQDPNIAIQVALDHNYSLSSKFMGAVFSAIPIAGIPHGILHPIWRKLRDIALIAAINGYDVESKEEQLKILEVLFLINRTVLPTVISQGCTAALAPATVFIVESVASDHVARQEAIKIIPKRYYDMGFSFGSFWSENYAVETAKEWEKYAITLIQQDPMFTNGFARELKQTSIVIDQVDKIVHIAAPIAIYATAIPITLFVNWLFDNSDKIFTLAKDVFAVRRNDELTIDQ